MRTPLAFSFCAVLQISGLLVATPVRADGTPPDTTLLNQRIEAISKDGLDVVAVDNDGKEGAHEHLAVNDPALQQRLGKLHAGDRISLAFEVKNGRKEVRLFAVLDADPPPTPRERSVALVLSALICFLLYWLLSGLHPLKLVMGEDGRYSNSKFQIALWFFVVITTYIATLWLRARWTQWEFIGGINIPGNLLLISGMSALTYGAAKGITTAKVAEAQSKGIADPKCSATAKASLLGNLTHNDGKSATGGQPQLDLGDFQMIVVTLLAVAVYFGLAFEFLGHIEKLTSVTLPDVDTTILAAFGIGHGAYLTKKAVGQVGDS